MTRHAALLLAFVVTTDSILNLVVSFTLGKKNSRTYAVTVREIEVGML